MVKKRDRQQTDKQTDTGGISYRLLLAKKMDLTIYTSILNDLSIFSQAHLLSEDDWEELLLASDDEEVHEDDGTGTRQRGRK